MILKGQSWQRIIMPEDKRNNNESELTDEVKRLRAAVEELSVLNDISTAISSVSSLDKVIEMMVKKCIKHLDVEQCSVTLLEENKQDSPFKTFIRRSDKSGEIIPYRLNSQLTGWMISNKKTLITNDIYSDKRFFIKDKDQPIKSLLSVPLILKGELKGSINVFNKKGDATFSDDDVRLLSIIATQSAQVIENARLYDEEKKLLLLREEMETAYNIQMKLLPDEPPRIPGYDVFGKSIPAKEVGGDYFDFIFYRDNEFVFCLGDVVGKGIPAALLMSNTQATLRGQIENNLSPAKCMEHSNSLLYESTSFDRFVTLFLGILDYSKHIIKYCNAGHNYPLLFRKSGGTISLDTGDLVLGAIEKYSYNEGQTEMEPGDTLLLYSDGITEAFDENDEQYGEEKLKKTVEKNINESARELSGRIVSSVREHTGTRKQSDDITLMIIKRSE
jgi:sigma-B regulation protein RsbU (phosphoserine phosphatase)